MKAAKYLFVLFIGTVVYVILSLTVGQNSISCYKQLEEQKRIVSKQKSDIQNINDELVLELTALKKDRAIIASYARKLDYVSDGEKLVKIKGLKPFYNSIYETGTVIRHEEPSYVSEYLCKIAGLCVSLIWFLVFLLKDLNENKTAFVRKTTYINGVPIYDIPQI